jgi:hypothetical protein
LALALGILGGVGLQSLGKFRRSAEIFSLLPSLLPVLFTLLSLFAILKPFPFGLWGTVIVHAAINVGVSSVAMARLIESRLGPTRDLALMYGLSNSTRRFVYFKQILPGITQTFFVVLVLCFTSYSVPVVTLGGNWFSSEVETVKELLKGNYSNAFLIAVVQGLLILFFGYFLNRTSRDSKPPRLTYRKPKISVSVLSLIPLGVTAFLSLSFALNLKQGFAAFKLFLASNSFLVSEILGSLLLGILVGLLTLSGLLIVFNLSYDRNYTNLLNLLPSPSTGLLTFLALSMGYYWFGTFRDDFWIIALPLFLMLSYFLSLYRWLGFSEAIAFSKQSSLMRVFEIHWFSKVRKIILPTSGSVIFKIAGISGFWACGDFALSDQMLGNQMTLGRLAYQILGGYQIELALWIFVMIFLVGSLVYVFFERIGRVFN